MSTAAISLAETSSATAPATVPRTSSDETPVTLRAAPSGRAPSGAKTSTATPLACCVGKVTAGYATLFWASVA